MADKPPDFSWLSVKFENAAPKGSDDRIIRWLKYLAWWLAFVVAMQLLAWLLN